MNRKISDKNEIVFEIFYEIIQTVQPVSQFAKDSIHLVKMCTKPEQRKKIVKSKEEKNSSNLNGSIGYNSLRSLLHLQLDSPSWDSLDFLSNSHIPINNIIVGSQTIYCYIFFFVSFFFQAVRMIQLLLYYTFPTYVYKFYEYAASSILLSKTKK